MVAVVVLGVIGLVIVAIALKLYASVRTQRGRGVRVVAEVVRHDEYTSHGQTMFYPIYAATLDGKRVEGQAATTMAKTWPSPKRGAKRTIIYRAGEDPPFSELGFVPLLPALIMGVLGAALLTVAIGIAMVSPSDRHIEHKRAAKHAHSASRP